MFQSNRFPAGENIEISKLRPNPFQPRFEHSFSDLEIERALHNQGSVDFQPIYDLVASIKENGLQQPIGVVRHDNDDSYIVIFGHRRVMAYILLSKLEPEGHWDKIPAIIQEDQEGDMDRRLSIAAITENLQRQELNIVELAKCYYDAVKNGFAKSYLDLAKTLGKGRDDIYRVVSVLSLTDDILDDLSRPEAKKDGRALASIAQLPPKDQWHTYDLYQRGVLTRSEVMRYVNNALGKGRNRQSSGSLSRDVNVVFDKRGVKLRASAIAEMSEAYKELLANELQAFYGEFVQKHGIELSPPPPPKKRLRKIHRLGNLLRKMESLTGDNLGKNRESDFRVWFLEVVRVGARF